MNLADANLQTEQHLQTRRSETRINPRGNFAIQAKINLNNIQNIQKIPEKLVANGKKADEWSDEEAAAIINETDADDLQQMREDSGVIMQINIISAILYILNFLPDIF
jgi:type II secretory pathway component PulK